MQPWRFVVVQGNEAVDAFVRDAIFEFCAIIGQEPVLLVVCAKPDDDVEIGGKEYYLFDTGMAVQNILLAATDLGLVTHPVASFQEEQVKRILHIPAEYRVLIITPLAYPLEGSYDEAAGERLSQRTRKPLEEVANFNRWGTSE